MLRSLPRRGFTLLEITVSTCMMLIVSGAVYRLLVTTQRLSRAQAEQVRLQSNVRAGSLFVANALRELSTVAGGSGNQNDLLSIGSSEVTLRIMRGTAFVCQPSSGVQIRIGHDGFSGYRDPQPGRDSLYLLLEGAETGGDDTWLSLPITQVSTTAPCSDGAPGIALTVPSMAVPADIPMGTPVRLYEIMQLKLYRSEGKSWLGARSVSGGEAIQPILGPLTDENGFRLEYLDHLGTATNDVSSVQSVRITLRANSEGPVPLEEELITQVSLRNVSSP